MKDRSSNPFHHSSARRSLKEGDRECYSKRCRQRTALYGDLIKDCYKSITETGDVVVCTVAQFGNEWSKNMDFPLTLIDEATVVSEAQFLLAWTAGRFTRINSNALRVDSFGALRSLQPPRRW